MADETSNTRALARETIVNVELEKEMSAFDRLSGMARQCLRYSLVNYSAKQFAEISVTRGESNIIRQIPIWLGKRRERYADKNRRAPHRFGR
jgi:hypothetical protein